MKLYFTNEEKKVVLALATAMVVIDENVKTAESLAAVEEACRMEIDPVAYADECARISPEQAISCVSKMSIDKKKYVYSVMSKIMVSDRDIHPMETSLLFVVSKGANIPEMSPAEIRDFLNSVEIV